MKKYSFREVIANIKEGEKWTDGSTNISNNIGKIKIEDFNGSSEASYTYSEDYREFIKVETPVAFMDVVNSDKKCNVEYHNYKLANYSSFRDVILLLIDSYGESGLKKAIKEGVWYLESEVNEQW